MSNVKKSRLVVLDGIRGFAIILVFLAHIEVPYHFLPFFPYWLNLLLNQTIFNNGVLGVCILFILSGFLMMYLYPDPENIIHFIQKRYSRIFPLYIAICLIEVVLLFLPWLPIVLKIIVLFVIPLLFHFVWVNVIKKKNGWAKIIFLSFFISQGIILLAAYISLFFYGKNFIQKPNIFTTISLLYPLTGSLPLVVRVSWSLCFEIYFYILYPLLIAPLLNCSLLKNDTRKFIVFLFFSPLCYLFYILSSSFPSLQYIHPEFFYFFLCGIFLGYVYRKKKKFVLQVGKIFNRRLYYASSYGFLVLFVLYHFLRNANIISSPFSELLLTFPFTFFIAITLGQKNHLTKIFEWKVVRFMGNISYSLYLTHLITLSLLYTIIIPKTSHIADVLLLFFGSIATIVVAYIVNILLEKPYFSKS